MQSKCKAFVLVTEQIKHNTRTLREPRALPRQILSRSGVLIQSADVDQDRMTSEMGLRCPETQIDNFQYLDI